jgi:hydrogenase/urease accessory protein HupE
MTLLRALLLLLLCAIAMPAHADVFRPAYLEVREVGNARYAVTWKVPAQDANTRLALHMVFPEGTQRIGEARSAFDGTAVLEHWEAQRPGGLAGQSLRVEGNAVGTSDVIVRIERRDGTTQVEVLNASHPSMTIAAATGTGEVAWSYLVLGVGHILGGFDHLLFVLALLLLVRGNLRIVATVTAFTVAHSLTLVAATLGWVHVPGPPVEAIIALSIVFVAAEVVHGLRGKPGLTARAPWVVAFAFGLLHGFGFAGALAEVGLPQDAIPLALLMFNVGVEVGQLLFVGAVLLALATVRWLRVQTPKRLEQGMAYAIGSVAAFWTIERIGGWF